MLLAGGGVAYADDIFNNLDVLRVRQGAGHGIRRYATSVRPNGDGWDLVEAPFSDVGWFAEHLASFGRSVIVAEPADLREAVITQLKGALA